ncbi:MAG TPA: nitronate monooxygenase family protein [Pseudonocardia sp.]|jgi:NAD(P)H-dependent flavin oxidoreductase YrpB (nitropropane dioxygenase family)
MRTPLARSLGVEFPIVAFSHCRDVVVAVSQAGGLGVLGAGANPPDRLDVELRWIAERLGDRPFGVDFLIPNRYVGRDEGGLSREGLRERLPAEHQAFLEDLLTRYGVPPLPETTDDGRHGNISHQGARELLEVAMSHRPALIANALGPPTPEMVTRAHQGGAKVASLVGRPEHAIGQLDLGVDVIVAQGYEAGGHTGEIATMVLTPAVVAAVSPTPVLAAGGIATGRQIAAALALGAQGVWTGSVWLTTAEAETPPAVREKMLKAGVGDTVRSRCSTGKPARQLRTAWTEEWDAPTSPDPLPMPLQLILTAEAKRRIDRATAQHPGARELATYYVGQVVGLLDRERTSKQVMQRMIDEYIEAVGDLAASLHDADPTD